MKKRLVLSKKEICTIPNLLTLIRMLLVPVYMAFLILGAQRDNMTYVFISLGVMLFASLTDVFDGFIARTFNQGSYVGQLIDPIADKLMHIGAIAALTIAGYLHWIFIIFIAIRELLIVIVGACLMNKVNIKSNMLGKIASATVSVGIITCFFHPFISQLWGEFGIDWILVTVGLVLNWAAAINYGIQTLKYLRAHKGDEDDNAESVDQNEFALAASDSVSELDIEKTASDGANE